MDPITLGLIMGGTGLVSGWMNAQAQKRANEQQTKMAAAQAEFSPWTNMRPETPQIKPADPVGGALAGGLQGGLSGVMAAQGKKEVPQAKPTYYGDSNEDSLKWFSRQS